MPSAKSAPLVSDPRSRGMRGKTALRLRGMIDEIDTRILDLLSERVDLSRAIGAQKKAQGRMPEARKPGVFVPEREEEIFRRIKKAAEAKSLPWPLVQAVLSDVVSLCRAVQGASVVAHVLGPAGTNSEWAARARFGEAVSVRFHDGIPAAIRAAELAFAAGSADELAVVPLENSQEGTVSATVDTLVGSGLKLVGEGYYRVRHALLSRAKALSHVKTLFSHPMGFAQCQRWVHENLPHARRIEVSSTAEAARHASAASASKDTAAIASPYLAGHHGLSALAADIQDSLENTTRFGVLGGRAPEPTGEDKTSLVFSLPNRAGSLSQALEVFSRNKLNMTKIESRPQKGLQWEYLFFVDVDGHAADKPVARALEAFGSHVRAFKVLGAYPKGRAWN